MAGLVKALPLLFSIFSLIGQAQGISSVQMDTRRTSPPSREKDGDGTTPSLPLRFRSSDRPSSFHCRSRRGGNAAGFSFFTTVASFLEPARLFSSSLGDGKRPGVEGASFSLSRNNVLLSIFSFLFPSPFPKGRSVKITIFRGRQRPRSFPRHCGEATSPYLPADFLSSQLTMR